MEVTSYDQLALGNFSFSARTLDNSLCENLLVFGETKQGLIDAGCDSVFRHGISNDPYGPRPGNYYAKRFEFELTEAGAFTFTLNNSTSDAYLYLAKKDEYGQLSLLNESMHEPYYRTSRNVGFSSVLDAGIYVIEATTEYPEVSTQFSLTMRQNTTNDCAFYMDVNQVINTSIDPRCPSSFKESRINPDPYGTPPRFIFNAKAITFKVDTAGNYTLYSVASGFNPHLFLVEGTDRDGHILLDQSFSSSDANSSIYLEPGFYTVEVTSSQSTSYGSFTFSVTNGDISGSECNYTLSTEPLQTLHSVWTTNCTSDSRPGSYAKFYDFNLSTTSEVQINLNSNLDAYLNLVREIGGAWTQVSADDDSGDGLNSQIIETLEPGHYRIEATNLYYQGTGAFQLIVKGDLDADSDGDGVSDNLDKFPDDPHLSGDLDGDGYDDLVDNDDDNDGVIDFIDAFPRDVNEHLDSDKDGIGDNSDDTPYLSEGVVSIDSAQYEIDENAKTVTITINRSNHQSGISTVYYYTRDDTAIANVHYRPVTGVLSFAYGEESKEVTVEILDDNKYDGDKSFEFYIASVMNANEGDFLASTIQIKEDEEIPDTGVIAWASLQHESDESGGTIYLQVQRLGPATTEAAVSFATKDGTAVAGRDYKAQSGVLTFLPGETEKSVQVTLIDDSQREANESFVVQLANPTGGTQLSLESEMKVVISDNDFNINTAEFSFADDRISFKEKAGTLGVSVVRSGNVSTAVSVEWNLLAGSANPDDDYKDAQGILEYSAGETVKFIAIELLSDDVYELRENFFIKLLNPSEGAEVVSDTLELVTVNDDAPNYVEEFTLSGSRYVVDENSGKVTVTVMRNFSNYSQSSIDYMTVSKLAMDNADYEGVWDTLYFDYNEYSKTVEINLIDDYLYEGKEDFIFRVHNPNMYSRTGEFSEAIVQINDNEPAPVPGAVRFSGEEYTVNEVDGLAKVTVQRLHGFEGDISVAYQTVPDTAEDGEHYSGVSGVLHFSDGEMSKTIDIEILSNNMADQKLDFEIELSQPMGTVIEGNPTAKVTIVDRKPKSANNGGGDGGGSLSVWLLLVTFFFFWLLVPNINRKQQDASID
ncbi:MAG: Calx-beta domain-containing protein [Gammaproteobacteria bacterium]